MNPTTSYVGKWVTYRGSNTEFYGIDFLVLNENASSVQFDAGIYGIIWRHKNAVSEPFTKPDVSTENFLNPHASSVDVIDNELSRLKARIEELEAAKKVLLSL